MQHRAFEGLKSALCAAPLLIYPDSSVPYTVVSDASGDAVGGVLMQDQGEGLRPVAFMSRAFKPTERQYLAYERELAAVAYCFIQWRHYLVGLNVRLINATGHKPSPWSCISPPPAASPEASDTTVYGSDGFG